MPMSPRLLRPRAAASSAFDPRQIAGLGMWLDTSDTATVTTVSGNVSEWRDKSGNGVNATQANAADRPAYSGTLNGRNTITFSGGVKLLSLPLIERGVHTAFVVADDKNGIGNVWLGNSASSGTYFSVGLSTESWSINGLNSAANITSGQVNIGGYVRSSTTMTAYANGLNGASPATSGTFGFDQIGKYWNGSGYAANGQLCEILIYDAALTTAQRQQVERYLSAKWGIPLYSPPTYADAGVNTYITAVEAADGQALETGVRDAINTFITGCKSDGIWSAIKASCILMGARTLSGALTPLVGSAPTNNGPFVSGDYNRKTGLVGNGSSKYIATAYTFTGSLQNNRHGSVYVSTAQTSGSHAYFGAALASATATPRTQLVAANGAEGQLISRCADESGNTSATNNNVAGFQGLSRAASDSYVRRANQTNQTISVTSLSGDDNAMWVFARNNATPSTPLYTTGRIAWYSFGESLTLSLLDSRVSTLYTAIGAAIP